MTKIRIGAAALGLALATLLLLAPTERAWASLIGQNVTVTFQEPGFMDESDSFTVEAGPELEPGDGSSIGDNILLAGEFVDVMSQSIVYRVRGDGPAHGTPGYFTTGFDADAQYFFQHLDFDPPVAGIVGVNVVLSNVIGVAVGSEVFFTPRNVWLRIGTLGVGEVGGGPDLGTITLELQVATPEPGLLALLLLGLPALAWRTRSRP